jgi:uncharacterized SAM-binding protein YcdF (DUF218 family)
VSLRIVMTDLLVPPLGLVLLGLIGQMLPRGGRWITVAALIGLLILSLPAAAKLLFAPLETNLPVAAPANTPPQAIVILSAEAARGGGAAPRFAPGAITFERLGTGAALYRRTHLPVLVSGGVIGSGDPPLASLMVQSLSDDFDVPVRWIEPHSRDTWQNAADSYAMLAAADISSIYLVSSGWHLRRALIAFGRFPLTITVVPTLLDAPPVFRPDDFIPSMAGWRDSYFALHEWIGCAYYALRRRFASSNRPSSNIQPG